MFDIYYLFLLVITAIGSSVATMYVPSLVTRVKRVLRKKKRNSLEERVRQLEFRVELHTKKDKTYLDKFDEMEALFNRRENDRKSKVRKQVVEYLEELKNG